MNICNIFLKYQICPLFCQDWCLLWLLCLKLPIRFSDTKMKLGTPAISYIMNALIYFIFSLFYAVILLFLIYSKQRGRGGYLQSLLDRNTLVRVIYAMGIFNQDCCSELQVDYIWRQIRWEVVHNFESDSEVL